MVNTIVYHTYFHQSCKYIRVIYIYIYREREREREISKYLWKLKEENADYNLQWSIKANASPYKYGARKCDFCLTEKMIIVRSDPKKLLKKRT